MASLKAQLEAKVQQHSEVLVVNSTERAELTVNVLMPTQLQARYESDMQRVNEQWKTTVSDMQAGMQQQVDSQTAKTMEELVKVCCTACHAHSRAHSRFSLDL